MANVLIEILEGGDPRPNPASIQHGDTVTFQVVGTQSVEVNFDPPYCLTDDTPVMLDGSNPAMTACSPRAVASTALKGGHSYHVTVLRAGVVKAGSQKEGKQGDLEVTTDPPKDKDKR
jgi:hypothetical protein